MDKGKKDLHFFNCKFYYLGLSIILIGKRSLQLWIKCPQDQTSIDKAILIILIFFKLKFQIILAF